MLLIINTLACVLNPLDTLDKLLRTKDPSYVNYPMHVLGSLNGVIWTLYHFKMHAFTLSTANFLGLACEAVMAIGCLYAHGSLGNKHPAVLFAKMWVNYFYNIPKHALGFPDEDFGENEKELLKPMQEVDVSM